MRLQNFPWCCGATILGEFPEGYYYTNNKQKRKYIELMEDLILTSMGGYNGGAGILLAITNRDQLNTSILLKKFGFKLLRQFYNPNSGYRLNLWELNLNITSENKINRITNKLIKQIV